MVKKSKLRLVKHTPRPPDETNNTKPSRDSRAFPASDFWDTAGQERFNSMHPSYYYRAHCCILVSGNKPRVHRFATAISLQRLCVQVFDVGRKSTYKNLTQWYSELREHCPSIPTIVCANKIDSESLSISLIFVRKIALLTSLLTPFPRVALSVNKEITKKSFNLPTKYNLPLFFASAADGTNVVSMFEEAISQVLYVTFSLVWVLLSPPISTPMLTRCFVGI